MGNWRQRVVLVAILVAGCSGGQERVKPPRIDRASAAKQAIELYDTNHDGKLSKEELAKCPGVLISIDGYDTNHDKFVDEEEILNHLNQLLRNGTGATQLACNLVYQGKPLAGAKVVFEPEPYLGTDIQSAEGVTNNYGAADLGMPPEKAPAALKNMKLIQYGTFKVRITHPTISIPAKYNTETTLGYETIPGQPTVSFALN
jgi:hypothetical protein